MSKPKELKDLSVTELKAGAYERACLIQRFNMELQAIEQEIQKREVVETGGKEVNINLKKNR